MTLEKYNKKRDFDKTSEPRGKGKTVKNGKKLRFVVQHHLARRDHYDFRLEMGGVLKSWAVPKGPSYDTKVRRLAVMVEDHPLEYRNFEGTIPKGAYGAGTVQLWDEGYYKLEGSREKSLKNGSLKFELFGKRLKGKWTLVHFKEDNWLLIKEKDGVEVYTDIAKLTTSIRTGRTIDEISTGKSKKRGTNSLLRHVVMGTEITSPDKVIFENPKITKYDIALYYKRVAKRMFPLVENRIVSTIRMPDGVGGNKFFKKHLENVDGGLGTVKLSSKDDKRDDYYYFTTEEGIISEVQMNSFEFHIWGSRVENLERPDMMVFDLDPDEKLKLDDVREGVRDLKSILDELGLESYLKTSGGKGYHVVVPIKKLKNWDSFRDFAQNVAKLMESKWPLKYTSNIRKDKRKGKIFIDWIRNTRSATSVAPYSLRLKSKPRVSMPIKWSELDHIDPDGITMEEAVRRLRNKDPWEGFLNTEE